jgi:hypothetical protein
MAGTWQGQRSDFPKGFLFPAAAVKRMMRSSNLASSSMDEEPAMYRSLTAACLTTIVFGMEGATRAQAPLKPNKSPQTMMGLLGTFGQPMGNKLLPPPGQVTGAKGIQAKTDARVASSIFRNPKWGLLHTPPPAP